MPLKKGLLQVAFSLGLFFVSSGIVNIDCVFCGAEKFIQALIIIVCCKS